MLLKTTTNQLNHYVSAEICSIDTGYLLYSCPWYADITDEISVKSGIVCDDPLDDGFVPIYFVPWEYLPLMMDPRAY